MSDKKGKRYRGIVTRANGVDEDWGFFDLRVDAGTLFIRANEATAAGAFDNFIAAGQWLQVVDIFEEEYPHE
jgi:hypothetical protein